ncbi:wall-associated receptor kinase-like 14 [Cryptomeria japonica]|uniref:wall-associated receptor kinase-like 14 n=1 Tax=Cryptomeria japonica TaxID=3369 RepID=UPI0027DA66A4|nr:wall-associated receptor kinase-like 14 [Cryptomeria japonica]
MRKKLQLQHGFLGLVPILLSVLSTAQSLCNRTCGSRTVRYPFGFNGDCPYTLDKDCSPNGEVYLKGYEVVDITNSSVMVDPWSKNRNSSNVTCTKELNDISSDFRQQFALTDRNFLILGPNCTQSDCNFNLTNLLDLGNRRNSCREADMKNFTCMSNMGFKGWLPWEMLQGSTCKTMLSSIIYEGDKNFSVSISIRVNNIELGWWVDGNCSCSANATCQRFLNPNNNQTVHRCSCIPSFQGDGFLEGTGCIKDSGCNSSGSCGSNSKNIVMISSIVAATVVVIASVVVYYIRRASAVKKRTVSVKRLLSANGTLTIPIYSYKELEKATKNFSDKEKLGSGAFGTVYAGKLPSKRFVAVKKIRYMGGDDNGMQRVLNEINLISSVDHPNLLRLLGCCLEERGEPILVYEFMPNGTLCEHLRRERGEALSWRKRLKIAADTAAALAYLHSAINPPIYHRDIKSSNILLDYDFNCKVADFGLSKLVLSESSHISTAPQGTPGYVDPQYHQNFHLSDKSDVYSFGVVLAEMITALKVVDFTRRKDEINLAWLAVKAIGSGIVDEIADPFLMVDKNSSVRSSVHRVAELAFRCLAFDKDARPCMIEAANYLSSIADEQGEEDNGGLKLKAFRISAPQSDQDPSFSSLGSVSSDSVL